LHFHQIIYVQNHVNVNATCSLVHVAAVVEWLLNVETKHVSVSVSVSVSARQSKSTSEVFDESLDHQLLFFTSPV